jgi:hypothetical protein
MCVAELHFYGHFLDADNGISARGHSLRRHDTPHQGGRDCRQARDASRTALPANMPVGWPGERLDWPDERNAGRAGDVQNP